MISKDEIQKYLEENLVDLSSEFLDWYATGILHAGEGGKVRILARKIKQMYPAFEFYQAIGLAETMIKKEAMKVVVSRIV